MKLERATLTVLSKTIIIVVSGTVGKKRHFDFSFFTIFCDFDLTSEYLDEITSFVVVNLFLPNLSFFPNLYLYSELVIRHERLYETSALETMSVVRTISF